MTVFDVCIFSSSVITPGSTIDNNTFANTRNLVNQVRKWFCLESDLTRVLYGHNMMNYAIVS